jgi:hypothetical protein
MKAPSLPDAENLLIPESLMAPSEPRMVGRKMEKLNPKKKNLTSAFWIKGLFIKNLEDSKLSIFGGILARCQTSY